MTGLLDLSCTHVSGLASKLDKLITVICDGSEGEAGRLYAFRVVCEVSRELSNGLRGNHGSSTVGHDISK